MNNQSNVAGKTKPVEKADPELKCDEVRSKELKGRSPGNRGACEKQSAAQGSE